MCLCKKSIMQLCPKCIDKSSCEHELGLASTRRIHLGHLATLPTGAFRATCDHLRGAQSRPIECSILCLLFLRDLKAPAVEAEGAHCPATQRGVCPLARAQNLRGFGMVLNGGGEVVSLLIKTDFGFKPFQFQFCATQIIPVLVCATQNQSSSNLVPHKPF